MRSMTQVALGETGAGKTYLLEDSRDNSCWLLRPFHDKLWAWYPLYPLGVSIHERPHLLAVLLADGLACGTVWEFDHIADAYGHMYHLLRERGIR